MEMISYVHRDYVTLHFNYPFFATFFKTLESVLVEAKELRIYYRHHGAWLNIYILVKIFLQK